jgi:hypothetical protein
MKRIKTLWLVATILLLSVSLFGQDTKSDVLSYSLSYIPPSLTSWRGEFEFAPTYINFEANIHYKPFDRISFSSGLGYSTKTETIFIDWGALVDEPDSFLILPDSYHIVTVTNFRIPIQFNYHISKSPDKSDWYLKAVYTNGFFFYNVRSFGSSVLSVKNNGRFYEPSAGIGLGSIFLKNKPVGIIVEGTISKHLHKYALKYGTWYSLKIGVVL